MPAHQWELRADVRPLDDAAARWSELGRLMAQRADDLVGAARHALDGWEAVAAEAYEEHCRQVVANLDRFTTLAAQVAGSLRALSSMITVTQKELDQAWVDVSPVPHQVVGPDRRLVFREEGDDDRAKVSSCQLEATEIRRRLTSSLDQESTRLRTARAELTMVRASLVDLAGRSFPAILRPGVEESGVGIIAPSSSSVVGTAESGVAVGSGVALAPIAPNPVSMPTLSGLATAGLTPTAGLAPGIAMTAGGAARRDDTSSSRLPGGGAPPMIGGMAAGAGRGASSLRGGGAGRRTGGGSGSLVTPRLTGEDEATRTAREKEPAKEAAREAAREAKRAQIAEKRAARAARKAEREAAQDGDTQVSADERDDVEEGAEPRPAHLAVAEVAPDEQPTDSRL